VASRLEHEGQGASLLKLILAQPRVQCAHRLGEALLVEAELPRVSRPEPVPFVLGYTQSSPGGWTLDHAHAGASSVTIVGDGSYLLLSDMRSEERRALGYAGRSLWRCRAGAEHHPELLFGSRRDVVSYAAASSIAVAAVWMAATALSVQEDRQIRADKALVGCTASMVSGDLWPRSCYQMDGEVLRLLRVPLHSGPAEVLPVPLERDVSLTGELAITPDGASCAAGIVRFLRGGHRRYGLLLFSASHPAHAQAIWWSDDLGQSVPSPDGLWFACTAERVATPGRAPRQEVVLVSSDGSDVRRAAPQHCDWLQPRAWADADTVLCVGERDGKRGLWRITPDEQRIDRIGLDGSVLAVTASAGDALIVRSGISFPPEVLSIPLDTGRRQAAQERRLACPAVLLAPATEATPTGRMERLTYPAPDGTTWRAWLCLPDDVPAAPLPTLVWCHGGPLLSWTDWSWRWNPWPFIAEGYAVVMPDPPLSLGYGQEAVERGWGHWYSEVAATAAAQVKYALADPRLDENNVAAMGGSFGGYLSLALGTLLPGLRLIVSHCGWADFRSVASVCDLHWHWLREYGPIGESASYRLESLCLAAISRGTKVLLSHGCDDAHVPVGEARAIYRALEARGVDVELMLFSDEKHSIRRPANVAAWYQWVLDTCQNVLGIRSERKELPSDDRRFVAADN